MFGLAVLSTLLVLFLKAFVIVPRNNFGAVYFCGKYSGGTLGEGWHLIIPFLESVRCYSFKTQRRPIKVGVQSNEGDETSVEIEIEGQIEFYADRKLFDQYRRETDDTIVDGLINAVKQELQIVSGTLKAFQFVDFKEELVLLVNCLLRLQHPLPHGDTPPAGRLRFYRDHRVEAQERLRHEHEQEDRSFVEERYGIDIRIFTLSDADFSASVKKAFEAKKEAEGKMKGAEMTAEKKLDLAGRWQAKGLTPQEAANEADVTVGQAEKKIVSLEGGAAILEALAR